MKPGSRFGGFWPRVLVIFLMFVLINLLAAHVMSDCGLPAVIGVDACADDMVRAGWPLKFYEVGGLAAQNSLEVGGLVADILLGALVSFALAWGSLRLGRG